MTVEADAGQARVRARTSDRSPWPNGLIVGVVLGWITLVLALDAHGSQSQQRILGVLTWLVLVGLLWREASLVRVQTAVVIVFATAVEYTFSPTLEVYLYRFDNVPAYVPPGHGLVYLAAFAIGRTAFVRAHASWCAAVALVALGGYALWGVVVSPRTDLLGVFWYFCLVGFVRWGPSRGLYVGAAIVVTYLELVGTQLGTWAWQQHDPTGLVSIGNPPSGAAGGYGWFDLAALLVAPVVIARYSVWRDSRTSPSAPDESPSRSGSVTEAESQG